MGMIYSGINFSYDENGIYFENGIVYHSITYIYFSLLLLLLIVISILFIIFIPKIIKKLKQKRNIYLEELIVNNKKIGVSACLAGEICRYDGKYTGNKTIEKIVEKDGVFTFCPEMQGGLPIPREQAEIQNGDGIDVWNNKSKVLTLNGKDVTEEFKKGAYNALKMLQNKDISMVILKDGSPSCGCSIIYDGTFSGIKKNGIGVTTALFRKNKISVYSDKEIEN
jgi:uncharacterized protein YbbK (DUF523 family)